MSTKGKSRRSFLVDSVTGLNAAWVTANYPAILAAQEHVRQATQGGRLPQLAFFTAEQAAEIVSARLADLGYPDVEPENPYWDGRSITIADPDGWRVVLDWGLDED